MPGSEFKERRAFPRFNVKISVSYVDPFLNNPVDTYTHDISVEGLGLLLDKKSNCSMPIEICLNMPDNNEKILTRGTIIWSKSVNSNQYRIGIKFDGPKLKPIPLVSRTLQANLDRHPYHS
jgi:hypothetical protein